MSLRVAYLVVRYPTLSQTFLHREVEGLRRHGLEVHVFPCRQFDWKNKIEEQREPYTFVMGWQNVEDFFGTVWVVLWRRRGLLRELARTIWKYRWNSMENFWANVWGLIVGIALTRDMGRHQIQMIHAAWATMPATAAVVAAKLLQVPFSFGAHAYDFYRHGGDGFLKQKLNAAAFVHTATEENVKVLEKMAPKEKIILARRGLASLPKQKEMQTGEIADRHMVKILSVGRLVAKKGHRHQLEACRVLKERQFPFQLSIVGDGPLRKELEKRIGELELREHVELLGALLPEKTAKLYKEADIFWHTGVVDAKGDRDGLPNVVPEAMAHGAPVISSAYGGVTEAVRDGETGLLVDVSSPTAMADAVERLWEETDLRKKLTQNARHWVEENFMIENNTKILVDRFFSQKYE